MTPTDTQAVLTLTVLAAFADGDKHARERDEIKRIAEGLGQAEGVHLPTLYQDVLMKRVDVASAAASLSSTEAKQLAYEMAVCVCDADGAQSEAEARFLASLRSQLGLSSSAGRFAEQADELARLPLAMASATAAVPAALPHRPQAPHPPARSIRRNSTSPS